MWVAVFHFFESEQAAIFLQPCDNDFIRFPHGFACHAWHIRTETAVVHHWAINRQIVFLTNDVVIQTVCRRSVYQASTRIRCDVFTHDDGHNAV